MDTPSGTLAYCDRVWDDDIVPALEAYIRIPALSPAFDPDWEDSGHIDAAVAMFVRWAGSRGIEGIGIEMVRLPGRTPVIVFEIPGTDGSTGPGADTVLLYGHLDKQPEMEGWRPDLDPWTPVIENGRLYGRGGADDGYAMFGALTAIEAVRDGGGDHRRCVVLIEASEESGSPDLPAYIDALGPQLGSPSLVVCLDSGCADYEQLWVTTSLRGIVNGVLSVDIVDEGLHSGGAGGLVPSTFRIARQLLDRIEDVSTGDVLLESTRIDVPPDRLAQAQAMAAIVGDQTGDYPLVDGAQLTQHDPVEQILATTWRASLSTIGADGLPSTADGGNVLRPHTALGLSVRIPPTADPDAVLAELTETLTADPPYGATVTFEGMTGEGWNAPVTEPWLEMAAAEASTRHFGRAAGYFGEGGSIPFMGMLGEKFPAAQFLIIGVLGPGSNAHGPNEFLDISMGKKITACVADVLMAHAAR